ncbi:hypothetical protein RB195_022156 [Necator americanus]|uniref:Uncharacterized protein n=1 Tax=Necator americanus TaxID=51031 RepID=A0ABR1EE58_NECAM
MFEVRSVIVHLEEQGYLVQLRHIASQENPADCATRGVDKSQFHDHLWWKGPRVLAQPVEDWESAYRPITLKHMDNGGTDLRDSDNYSVECTRVVVQSKTACADIFHEIRKSDFRSIQRVVAFALCFIQKLVTRANRRRTLPMRLSPRFNESNSVESHVLSGMETTSSCKAIVKQHHLAWINSTTLAALRNLNPYADHQGILRCKEHSRKHIG